MLAEIAANPAAWPLWGVLVFAALMYPMGLLLPGCACCGSSACTQCGHFVDGYTEGQNGSGRMCCTGTIATSVTMRVTSVGPATSSNVERDLGSTNYPKRTLSFACSSIAGDYTLSLMRPTYGGTTDADCYWELANESVCETQILMRLKPGIYDPSPSAAGGPAAVFPNYYLSIYDFRRTISGSIRYQTCSGYPGTESCNIGSTVSSSYWVASIPASVLPFAILNSQQCSPSGVVLATNQGLSVNGGFFPACDVVSVSAGGDTGCRYRLELV